MHENGAWAHSPDVQIGLNTNLWSSHTSLAT
jgi:hypothetical protein